MFKGISRAQVVGAWVATIVVMFVCSVVAGGAITVGNLELWLAACLVPAGITLLLWHGEQPVTVQQLLSAVDTEPGGGRP